MAKKQSPSKGNGHEDEAAIDNTDAFGLPVVADDATTDISQISAEIGAGLGNLVSSIAAAGGVGGGLPFLSMDRAGAWAYGADRTEVDLTSELAIDVRTLKHGFVAWLEGKLVGEYMVPASQSLKSVNELPPVGAPYTPAYSFEGRFLSGEDKGVKVLYRSNSLGGRGAIAKLVEELLKRVQRQVPDIFPVVLLSNSHYTHSQYGKIYTPVFTIQRWFGLGGGGAPASPSPAPQAPPKAEAAKPAAGVRRRVVAD